MKRNIYIFLILTIILSCNESKLSDEIIIIPENKNSVIAEIFPEGQKFKVSGQRDTLLVGDKGTRIVIPAYAFVDRNNKPISGNFEIKLIEILTIEDIISSDLHTVSEQGLLESDGMLFINAKKKNMQLQISGGKQLYIELPTDKRIKDMELYSGNYDSNNNIIWTKLNELEKFLISVPLKTLDFKPDKFKIIRKEGEIPDSIYLLVGNNLKEAEKRALDLGIIVRDTIEVDPREIIADTQYYCIDYDIINFLKSNTFENTLIATREFEERMKYIHKICDENIIKIYLDNLDKNLWEIDSMVYEYLNAKNNNYSDDFLDFSNQKLTVIKETKYIEISLIQNFWKRKQAQIEKEEIEKEKRLKQRKEERIKQKKNREEEKQIFNLTYNPFKLTELGWINIDRLYVDPRSKVIDFEVQISDVSSFNIIAANLLLKQKKNYISLYKNQNSNFLLTQEGSKESPKMPVGETAVIFATGKMGQDIYYASYEVIIDEQTIVNIKMTKTTVSELKSIIKNL